MNLFLHFSVFLYGFYQDFHFGFLNLREKTIEIFQLKYREKGDVGDFCYKFLRKVELDSHKRKAK